MSQMYTQITHCRACGSSALSHVVNLGEQFIVDFPLYANTMQGDKAPLYLGICKNCYLVQLLHSVNPDRLYKTFWYRSGINEAMRAALQDIVDSASKMVRLREGDVVLDIGCNDGTLLSLYSNVIATVGIDPAENLRDEAMEHMNFHICDYGNPGTLKTARHLLGNFKIITAIAMFYDLEDPAEFLKACKESLADGGVLVIQMNYLATMLRDVAVDNVCHEHLTYFSLTTLKWLADRVGLQVVDVAVNDLNGGSIRVYMTNKGDRPVGWNESEQVMGLARVEEILEDEVDQLLNTPAPYAQFERDIEYMKFWVTNFIEHEGRAGKKIYIYGASTRGTVTVQLLPGIYGYIAAACERDERKFGRWMVGTGIPIVSEAPGRDNADYFLVLPWHFRKAILEREKAYAERGGKFIFPLPEPCVTEWDNQAQTWKSTELQEILNLGENNVTENTSGVQRA